MRDTPPPGGGEGIDPGKGSVLDGDSKVAPPLAYRAPLCI